MSNLTQGSNLPTCMMTGELIVMAGQLMSELNKGTLTANEVLKTMIGDRLDLAQTTADATIMSGKSTADGQLAVGAMSIIGGCVGIAGGGLALGSAGAELAALKNLSTEMTEGSTDTNIAGRLTAEDDGAGVEMNAVRAPDETMEQPTEPGAVAARVTRPVARTEEDIADAADTDADFTTAKKPMTAQEQELRLKQIQTEYGRWQAFGQVCGSALPQATSGVGSTVQSGYTALAAQQQAVGQTVQGASDTLSQQMSGTSGVVSNSQGAFTDASKLSSQYMQYLLALSQAH